MQEVGGERKSTRRKNKQQNKGTRLQEKKGMKFINHLQVQGLTIQTQILEAAIGEVVLHDGHERGHLTEEQHFVVCG